MSFFPMKLCGLLLAGGMFLTALAAPLPQSEGSAQGAALKEQQTTGKRLFNQNCALCHEPEPTNVKDPKDPGKTIGPRLDGLFKGEKARPEAVVRTFIQRGSEGKMPGFQYNFQPKDIDAIIAYLKTL